MTTGRARELSRLAGLRLGGMLGGAVASSIAVWIIVERFGADAYALYSLLVALLMMLPFADLGLGVAMVNTTTDCVSGDTPRTAFDVQYAFTRQVLRGISVVIIAGVLILYTTELWPFILGDLVADNAAQLSATLVVILIAIALPWGLGSRILQGRGEMTSVVAFALIAPAIQLVFLLPAALVSPSASMLAIVPACGAAAVAYFTDKRARRSMLLKRVRVLQKHHVPVNVRDQWLSAGAFLIISIGLVIAFQFQRVIVSQLSTPTEVATYSLVAQYLLPVVSIGTVAGQALWSSYRKDRRTVTPKRLARDVLFFGMAGIAFAALFSAVVVCVSAYLLSGAIQVNAGVLFAAALYIVIMFCHQPSAMFLNDGRGLSMQAAVVVIMAGVNVALTVSLVPIWGAMGAFVALTAALVTMQAIPTFWLACREIRSKRADLTSAPRRRSLQKVEVD